MNSQELNTAIENALNEFQDLFEYWVSELYDSYDEPLPSQLNEDNLALIEKDVMM